MNYLFINTYMYLTHIWSKHLIMEGLEAMCVDVSACMYVYIYIYTIYNAINICNASHIFTFQYYPFMKVEV